MHAMIYHITEKHNKNSIITNGLIRNKHAFICLCESVDSWLGMFNKPCIFQVDIDSFMQDNPDVTVTTWQPQSDEICVWSDVPKEYIKDVNTRTI